MCPGGTREEIFTKYPFRVYILGGMCYMLYSSVSPGVADVPADNSVSRGLHRVHIFRRFRNRKRLKI